MQAAKVILQFDGSRVCGRGIILGVSKYCRLFGHWRLSQNLPYYFDARGNNQILTSPEDWLADGIILGSGEVPEFIRQLGIPIIVLETQKRIPGVPNIFADAHSIAVMALNHFMDHNHSQLAFLGFSDISWATERGKWFVECAKEKGFDVAKYEIGNSKGKFYWDDEITKIGDWISQLPYPSGLLVCNDDCAKLASAACELAHIRIPEDVAILGVDNDEMVCLPNNPPLSSIALDFEKAGFEAAALLDKMIKRQLKSEPHHIILQPTHIKVRRSTESFAVSDPEIQSALQFIKNHSREPIGVPDVVEATTLSRRSLEYHFKAVLGQSINKVIRSHRIQWISDMLIETNLPVSQIANELGFTDIQHIGRFFNSQKGMTPTAFRNRFKGT